MSKDATPARQRWAWDLIGVEKVRSAIYGDERIASATSVAVVPGGLLFREVIGGGIALQFVPCSMEQALAFLDDYAPKAAAAQDG